MRQIDVHRSTHRDLFAILKGAGYRKHSATVYLDTSAECSSPYWSDGSRSEFFLMHLDGTTAPLAVRARTPFGDPSLPWSETCYTGSGHAIVNGGIFRGKPAHWMVYIHPDDASAFGVGGES